MVYCQDINVVLMLAHQWTMFAEKVNLRLWSSSCVWALNNSRCEKFLFLIKKRLIVLSSDHIHSEITPVETMDHRLRRWPIIKPALGECFVPGKGLNYTMRMLAGLFWCLNDDSQIYNYTFLKKCYCPLDSFGVHDVCSSWQYDGWSPPPPPPRGLWHVESDMSSDTILSISISG